MKRTTVKKRFVLLSLVTLIFTVSLSVSPYFQHSENPQSVLADFDSFRCARFDYQSEAGIESKTIVFRIAHLKNVFQSLDLTETDTPFDEDWIFRIIFNWNGIIKNRKEVVLLISDSHIKMGDTNYVVTNGDFSDLLAIIHNLFDDLTDEGWGYPAD